MSRVSGPWLSLRLRVFLDPLLQHKDKNSGNKAYLNRALWVHVCVVGGIYTGSYLLLKYMSSTLYDASIAGVTIPAVRVPVIYNQQHLQPQKNTMREQLVKP